MLRKLVTTTTLQRSLLALACLSLACARSSMNPVSVGAGADPPAARRAQQLPAESSGSTNGAAGDMPAYYDAQLFTINFTELSSPAEAVILGHNDFGAWGGTVANFDVTDVYVETVTTPSDYPNSPRTVLFNGRQVPVLRSSPVPNEFPSVSWNIHLP